MFWNKKKDETIVEDSIPGDSGNIAVGQPCPDLDTGQPLDNIVLTEKEERLIRELRKWRFGQIHVSKWDGEIQYITLPPVKVRF